MKKLFTAAVLCLAGAALTTASATEQTAEFFGFGIHMGNYYDSNAVSYAKINVAYDAEEVGDEWTYEKEILFPANFNPGFVTHPINSAWIYDGSLYASRYRYSTCDWQQDDPNYFYNDVIQMDAEGNLINTINLGYKSKYGYLVKAFLNPEDSMLYCWTTDFADNIYFGKISPSKLNNFATEFTEIKSRPYAYDAVPQAFCGKGNVFYYFTNNLKLMSITTDGIETTVGNLKEVERFTASEWNLGSDYAGMAMIYCEDMDRFIWSGPCGLESSEYSLSARLYSFKLDGDTNIKNEIVALPLFCGSIPDSYWTTFVAPAELKEVELGTPKAPAEVTIAETDIRNRYLISWSPVTECVEEGKALDTPNLTYRVILNDSLLEENVAQTSIYVEIEPLEEPVDYTAHVWAVCPNAQSAEATSNTITVGAVGVAGVATDNSAKAIYTVLGSKVNVSSTAELPAGLYIVDGKKVVVK